MRKKFPVRVNVRVDERLDAWMRAAAHEAGQDTSALWRQFAVEGLRRTARHLEPPVS